MKHIYLLLSVFVLLGCGHTPNTSKKHSSTTKAYTTQAQMSQLVYRFQINFDAGSSKIKPKYKEQVKEFATYLKNNPSQSAEIHGHTDSDGSNSSNKILSQQRADAVVQQLLSYGITQERLKAIGYGETSPISSNNTHEGKFENRRVEARLKGSVNHTVLNKPGTIEGSVIDALTGKPLAGVSVKVYQKGKLLSFFTTDSHGLYRLKLNAGEYVLKFSRADYQLANINITVLYKEVVTISKLKQISMKYTGTGTIGGILSNAFNGKGVPNLNLNIRKNWNNKQGTVIKRLKTDSKGNYHINLPSGYYTIEAFKNGFSKTYFNVIVVGKNKILAQNSAISPQINKGVIRVVLTWGKRPLDLDAHLKTPNINGRSYEIYYKSSGSRKHAPYVDLDVDDRQSFGPETTTIYKSSPGIYYYTINNYSISPDIKSSGAKVQVYSSAGLVKQFNMPSVGNGRYWNVFSYDGETGQITSINKISSRRF